MSVDTLPLRFTQAQWCTKKVIQLAVAVMIQQASRYGSVVFRKKSDRDRLKAILENISRLIFDRWKFGPYMSEL